MALSGQYSGVARLEREGGRLRLRLFMRRPLPPGATAWLLFGERLVGAALQDGAAAVEEDALPEALLIGAGERLLCSGGFAGQRQRLESALVKMRMQAMAGAPPGRMAKPEAPEEEPARASRGGEAREAEEAQKKQAPPAKRESPPSSTPQGNLPSPQKPPPPRRGPQGRHAARPNAFPLSQGGESEALLSILQRAQTLFAPLQQGAQSAPPPPPPFCPFPHAFPGLEWRKVAYPGSPRCYLEARQESAEGAFLLHAIAGEYAPVPPVPGFNRFLRSADGSGYWIRRRRL